MAFIETSPEERIVDLRVKGETFVDIAHQVGLPAERCAEIFHKYLHESYSGVSEVEMRLTQLKRLESLLSYLWDIVRSGDAMTEGRQTANAIKIIEQINVLMGVHRDPLRDAQVELTKAQTDLLYGVLTHMRMVMLEHVNNGLRQAFAAHAGVSEDAGEYLREYLESKWPSWHAVSVNEARQLARADASEGNTPSAPA